MHSYDFKIYTNVYGHTVLVANRMDTTLPGIIKLYKSINITYILYEYANTISPLRVKLFQ